MIPDFDTLGNLPPGIWSASIADVSLRYAINTHRQKLFQAMKNTLEILQAANCEKVFLNGSFICDIAEPRDYDLCYEWQGMKPTKEFQALLEDTPEARKQKHLGDIFIRMPVPPFLDDYVQMWQVDRDNNVKGIIQIDLQRHGK